MKLVPKLALALFAGVLVVVAGYTALRVRGDIQLFDQDARRDQRVVGVTAGAALAKTRTREDAIRLARRVDASRELIRVRYVSLSPGAPAELRPLLGLAPGDLPRPGSWRQLVKPRTEAEDADVLVTYVAAPVVDDASGAMELSQPLASRAEYAWRGVWSALASSLAMAIVGGATMAFIGARVVGRPVANLIAAARRIGEGDFDALESSERPDELGELARAMQAMSADLSSARRRAMVEAEARIEALQQLRHAERLTTLGQLASVLAHEIGTPLNVIAGHGKMIESGKLDSTATHESARAIGEQCARITGIVRRVLAYARRSPPKRTSLDAGDTARQARAMLRSLADEKSVQIRVEERAGDAQLFADSDQLQQALTNIVLNAIHASPSHEAVEITIDAVERSVHGEQVPFVVFVVRDAGAGIDDSIAERIFEPFFTTKAPGHGTGLGLSIARDIVQEHGGFIELATARGNGTAFNVYLPRRPSEASD